MSVLTFFAAEMTCPVCGTVSPDTTDTGMSNKLLDTEFHSALRVGDSPDISLVDIECAFLTLNAPKPGEPVRILQDWVCPTCGSINWAIVVIEGRTVTSITAVPLNRRTLDGANFINERIYDYYEGITGEPLLVGDQIRADIWTVLRNALPE
jgi:hypothetical protein